MAKQISWSSSLDNSSPLLAEHHHQYATSTTYEESKRLPPKNEKLDYLWGTKENTIRPLLFVCIKCPHLQVDIYTWHQWLSILSIHYNQWMMSDGLVAALDYKHSLRLHGNEYTSHSQPWCSLHHTHNTLPSQCRQYGHTDFIAWATVPEPSALLERTWVIWTKKPHHGL